LITRITVVALVAALAGAALAMPAAATSHPQAAASKKCKKKKGQHKKKKGCRGSGSSQASLPGQATPPQPKQPDPPPPPPPVTPDLHVSALVVSDSAVLGGNSTTGRVTVDDNAPAGGQQVDLSSSVPARVQVPASVVVASGQTSATFPVDTTSGSPVPATLTGSIDTSSAQATLNVVDRPSVASVELERQCFTPGVWPSNRVTLDIPAPADTTVSLSGGDPLSLALPAPPTVTVPSGSTSAFFTLTALLPSAGDVTVLASAPSTPAQSDSASVTATAPDPTSASLALDPSTVIPGQSSTGTVTLDCEATEDLTFTLSAQPATAGNTSNVTFPPSGTVTVPAGELSADFSIATDSADTDAYEISVAADGITAQSTTLTVAGQPD
jgi:hypothetical protein